MEVATAAEQEELGFAECLCCGLTEECTAMYVASVRGRYGGRWICGLCAEAVEETCRSARLITMEEALQRQATFYIRFRSQVDSNDRFIAIVRRLIRRSLGSPSGGLQAAASGKEPSDSSLPVIIGGPLGGVGDGDLLGVKP